jgi:integrase
VTAVSVFPEQTFTIAEWASMLRDPTKDKRYLSTQLGSDVADYLSWKQNEDGAASATVGSYEYDLARLAVLYPDRAATGFERDHLRYARDLYPAGSRYKITAIYKDFFRWLYEEDRIDTNPAGRLRFPKKQLAPITLLFSEEEKAAIVAAQETLRDRICVLLLLRAGLRKGELRRLQTKDIDLADKLVLVRRGKGGKPRRVPVRGSLLRYLGEWVMWDDGLERQPEPNDHLLYPMRSANQHARGTGPNPKKRMADSTAHRWWYACLARAGVVAAGVTSGRRTHTTRHTYATDLGRATRWNMVAVQKNLGHARIGTTIDIYTQFSFEDQELAVEALPDIMVEEG